MFSSSFMLRPAASSSSSCSLSLVECLSPVFTASVRGQEEGLWAQTFLLYHPPPPSSSSAELFHDVSAPRLFWFSGTQKVFCFQLQTRSCRAELIRRQRAESSFIFIFIKPLSFLTLKHQQIYSHTCWPLQTKIKASVLCCLDQNVFVLPETEETLKQRLKTELNLK